MSSVRIKKVILADKTITDEDAADFVFHCVAQIHGPSYIYADLSKIGLKDCSDLILNGKIFDAVDQLDLQPLTSTLVKRVCEEVIISLQKHDDLGTIMGIEAAEAHLQMVKI